MIDELKSVVNDLSEKEAKEFLQLILLRSNMVQESEYTREQFSDDIQEMYTRLLHYHQRKNMDLDTNYRVAHIVFGDSTSGTLKMALKQMGLGMEEKVIAFSENFATGPVFRLDSHDGLIHRYDWLKNHINLDDEQLEDEHFTKTIRKINAIPVNIPIIIWVGDNAHEQTGLRFVVNLLKEKLHTITVMDTTKAIKELYNGLDLYLHTGEIVPEKLRVIYKSNTFVPLAQEEREQLVREWEELSHKHEVLRIWRNGQLHQVDEDFYDKLITETVRGIHKERGTLDFIKSARVIGEVIGNLNQYICDRYLEYRVRELVLRGILDIKGVPKDMRYYSVKLKEKKS